MGKRLRLEDKRDQEQSGRPQPGTEVKIAVDLARSKWVYCVRWEGAERLRLSTGSEIKHVQALVRRYEGCRVHLAFEACGFGYEVAWWAQKEQIAVTVIAPSRIERAPGLQVKTDRLDVGRMARQLEEGTLKGIYVPARADHERRQVVRTYGQAIKERKREQVRIRSLMQEHGRIGPTPRAGWKAYCEWLGTQELPEDVKLCVETLQAMRDLAERKAEVLEQRLLAMARSEDYRQIVAALCTQRGVGTLSAIRFVLEIGEIRRFPTADHRALSRPHSERVQLGGYGSSRTHPEVRTGHPACGDAAVRVGQRAQGRRCDAARGLRSAGPARGQETGDHCGDAPTRLATAGTLDGSVGGREGRRGVDGAVLRSAQRWRRIFPDRECLRNTGWSPPRDGTSDSFAALAFTGHGAPAGATNDNLVTVPAGTRTNNRLATTVLVCATRPARGQPREVALAVRPHGSRGLPSSSAHCHHDFVCPEDGSPHGDLTRKAQGAKRDGLSTSVPTSCCAGVPGATMEWTGASVRA